MITDVLAGLFVKIIIMIGIGFILKKSHVLSNELQKGLSSILLSAVLPASIIASANAELTAGMGTKLLYCSIIACSYFAGSFFIAGFVSKAVRLPREKHGIFVAMCMLPNSAFLGMPIVKALFGSEGMMYAVIFSLFWQVFAFSLGTMVLSGSSKINFRTLARDPATVASVLALALYLSPLRLPSTIVSALDDVGSMCLPLSLMIVGAGLADIDLLRILREKHSYIVSAMRLLVFPAIVLGAMLLFHVDPLLAATCVVLTATPVGSLNAVFAEQYGAPKDFAVSTIVQSTVLMLATLPLVILVCGQLIK